MSAGPGIATGAHGEHHYRIKRKPLPQFPYSPRYPPPDPEDPFLPLKTLRHRVETETHRTTFLSDSDSPSSFPRVRGPQLRPKRSATHHLLAVSPPVESTSDWEVAQRQSAARRRSRSVMVPGTPSARTSRAISVSDFRNSQFPLLQTPIGHRGQHEERPPMPKPPRAQNMSPPPPPPHLTPDNTGSSESELDGFVSAADALSRPPVPIPPRSETQRAPSPGFASSVSSAAARHRRVTPERARSASALSGRTLSSSELPPLPPVPAPLVPRKNPARQHTTSESSVSSANVNSRPVRMLRPRSAAVEIEPTSPDPAAFSAHAVETVLRALTSVATPSIDLSSPLPKSPNAGSAGRKFSLSVKIPGAPVASQPSPVRPFLLPRQRTRSNDPGTPREAAASGWRTAESDSSSDTDGIVGVVAPVGLVGAPLTPAPKPIPPPVQKPVVVVTPPAPSVVAPSRAKTDPVVAPASRSRTELTTTSASRSKTDLLAAPASRSKTELATKPKSERRLSRIPIAVSTDTTPLRPARVGTPPVQPVTNRAPAATPVPATTASREQVSRPIMPPRNGTYRSVREQIEDTSEVVMPSKPIVAERKDETHHTAATKPLRSALRTREPEDRPPPPPNRSQSVNAAIRERVENARPTLTRGTGTSSSVREERAAARPTQPSVIIPKPALRLHEPVEEKASTRLNIPERHITPPPFTESPEQEIGPLPTREEPKPPSPSSVLPSWVKSGERAPPPTPSSPVARPVRSVPPPMPPVSTEASAPPSTTFFTPAPGSAFTKPRPKRGMSDVTILSRTSTIVDNDQPPPTVLSKGSFYVRNPTEDRHHPPPSQAAGTSTASAPSASRAGYGLLSPLTLSLPPPSSVLKANTLRQTNTKDQYRSITQDGYRSGSQSGHRGGTQEGYYSTTQEGYRSKTQNVHRSNTQTTSTVHPSDSASFDKISLPKPGYGTALGFSPDGSFDEHVIPTDSELDRAAALTIIAENGVRRQFGDLWQDQKTVVIFVRHAFCPWDHDYMYSVSRHVNMVALERANVNIAVIGNFSAAMVKSYRKIFRAPFQIYTDPTQQLHAALGMTWHTTNPGPEAERGAYIRHSLMTGIAMVIINALRVGMPVFEKGGDQSQLGGEFVFGPGNKCSYAHRMTNTRSHAPILEVVRAAGIRPQDMSKSPHTAPRYTPQPSAAPSSVRRRVISKPILDVPPPAPRSQTPPPPATPQKDHEYISLTRRLGAERSAPTPLMSEPEMTDEDYAYAHLTSAAASPAVLPAPVPARTRERDRVQRRRPTDAGTRGGASMTASSTVGGASLQRRKPPRETLAERLRNDVPEYESAASDAYGGAHTPLPTRRDPRVVAQERGRAWQATRAGTGGPTNENDVRRDMWDGNADAASGAPSSKRKNHRAAGHRKPVRDYGTDTVEEEDEEELELEGSGKGTGRSSRKAKSTRDRERAPGAGAHDAREEDLAALYQRMQDHMGWSDSVGA